MPSYSPTLYSKSYAIMLAIVVIAASILTVPVLRRVSPHPDEHQFLLNAFKIMGGEELHNYLHIAATEYTLAGFFNIVNMITTSGVNFPQGSPTPVTYYYGRIFGFILYMLTFVLGAIVIQKRQSQIQLRTVIFAILYFGSLALFERFMRVNSDSFMIFIYLNFLVISLWQHLHKPSVFETFLLNALFVFLTTFTNIKGLFMVAPLVVLNTFLPFVWYHSPAEKHDKSLSKVYRLILYTIGILAVTLILWKLLVPAHFSKIKFWYTVKQTIIYGTQFDFDYPSQAFNSWLVYIYDLLVYQIGPVHLLIIVVLFCVALIKKFVHRPTEITLWGEATFLDEVRQYFDQKILRAGDVYKFTEIIILASCLAYYIGISTRVVHWSRWNAPLGMLAIMFLSIVLEKIILYIFGSFSKKNIYLVPFLPIALFFVWSLRIALAADIYSSGYSINPDYYLTQLDILKLLKEKNIAVVDAPKKVTWFTGYTPIVNNMSFEQIVEPKNRSIDYMLWPEWNTGLLLTRNNVDKSTSNQRAFVDTYSDGIEYRFPTALAYYMYVIRAIAWDILGITWIPEMDSLVESYYAVMKIKRPADSINLHYTVSAKDIVQYDSVYDLTFNLQNLKDSYMFPPCYTYQSAVYATSGKLVEAPPELAPFGKTAGLYCHTLRFRVVPKGVYVIKINGLPESTEASQIVYFNGGEFNWDAKNKIATFGVSETFITSEFGVATKEKDLPYLEFEVLYTLDQKILTAIEDGKRAQEAAKMTQAALFK